MVKRALITLICLGGAFVFLGRMLGLSEGRLEYVTSLISYPFLKAQRLLVHPITFWATKQRVKNNLLAEYENLVRQRDTLLQEVITLKGFNHYVRATEDQRRYNERFSVEPIIAPILLKNFARSHFLLLDAGTLAGVEKGMIAISHSCLLGRVIETYPLCSKVQLLTDSTGKVSVYGSSSGVKGIYTPQEKGHALLEYVDHRDAVIEGELLLSSGLGGVFPRGFCVGSVAEVQSTPYGRTIIVTSCIDVASLDYVSLLPRQVTAKA